MLRFKKILCPVDFDSNSLVALRLAFDLASERNATLRLLHVVAMPSGPRLRYPSAGSRPPPNQAGAAGAPEN